MERSLPSACPSPLLSRWHRRIMGWWRYCWCYRDVHSSRRCGFATFSVTTVFSTMWVWECSAVLLRVSACPAERSSWEFTNGARASLTWAVRLSRRMVRQGFYTLSSWWGQVWRVSVTHLPIHDATTWGKGGSSSCCLWMMWWLTGFWACLKNLSLPAVWAAASSSRMKCSACRLWGRAGLSVINASRVTPLWPLGLLCYSCDF